MAFAKAEALTMVCMKNRFWTLIAQTRRNWMISAGFRNLLGVFVVLENL